MTRSHSDEGGLSREDLGPRLLLKNLREIMGQTGSAQDRLDKLVSSIASIMQADVCSIYIRRTGDALELTATRGLKESAVHRTRLDWGEGLVGEIAESALALNLSNAPDHPKFAYRPETGEEAFHSFLGVPILKGGHVLGVLVVQNKSLRHYDDEEVEALQTVATVLAEVVASGQLIHLDETIFEAEVHPSQPFSQAGIPFAEGLAIGHVVLHGTPKHIGKLIADDVAAEKERLLVGLEELRASIDTMLSASDALLVGETRDVLEAYRLFANDRGWARSMEDAVQNGLTAEAAVQQVQNETRARMMRLRDPYMRERLHDLEDLANRLLRHLTGESDRAQASDLPHDAIIVARNLGPAELLDYGADAVRGVVLEEGSSNTHVAIVAKALGIPMVGSVSGLLGHINDDDVIIVDGLGGEVHVRPLEDVLSTYESKLALREKRQAEFASLRDTPAITRDGQRIQLNINAGLLVDLPHLHEVGADGIGLFRTELQFMVSSTMPRLKAQTDFYRQALDAAGERPVTFRTLDLGGDKILPYGQMRREENPALGLRAVRLALSRPAMLRYQLRAFLMAAQGRDLNVMFPMVSEVDEYIEARALLDVELERLEHLGHILPRRIRVGCMLEVPSLAWQIRSLVRHADFISVGSNDLMQFFFASDRNNPEVSNNYDFLSPSLLSLLRSVVHECQAADVPLTLCGEAAGRPLEAMALIGLGFRTISMPPAAIGQVKLMARHLHIGQLSELMAGLFDRADHSVRLQLKIFAENQGIPL